MKATRYLGVDYRDFFYLQLRDIVPGPNLSVPLELKDDAQTPGMSGRWATTGLVHNAEFPPRVAWTTADSSQDTAAASPNAPTANAEIPGIQIIQLDPNR